MQRYAVKRQRGFERNTKPEARDRSSCLSLPAWFRWRTIPKCSVCEFALLNSHTEHFVSKVRALLDSHTYILSSICSLNWPPRVVGQSTWKVPASQILVFTLNLTKETVSFIVNASSEEEAIDWPCGLSIPKGQSPKAIN